MAVQWTLLLFGLFAGIGLACLGIASIGELRNSMKESRQPLVIVALVLLVLGGVCSFFHLNSPARLFYILGNPSSGITVELILTGTSFVIGTLLLWLQRKPKAVMVHRVVAVCGIIMSVALPFSTGTAYSVMTARPAWATVFLPIMYLVAAWSGGLVLASVIECLRGKSAEMKSKLLRFAVVGIVAFAVAVGLWLVGVGAAPHQDPSRSVDLVLFGTHAGLFWGVTVLLGVVVPLVLLVLAWKKRFRSVEGASEASANLVALSGAALVSFMCGSAAIRVIVYLIGTSVHAYIYL